MLLLILFQNKGQLDSPAQYGQLQTYPHSHFLSHNLIFYDNSVQVQTHF